MSLGNLFVVFFFHLLHSLGQTLAYSVASSLFLACCFLRVMHQHLCWKNLGVTRYSVLGALVLGFLSCFFRDFLSVILMYVFFFRETEKFADFVGSFYLDKEAPWYQSRNIFLSFSYNKQVENTQLVSTIQP